MSENNQLLKRSEVAAENTWAMEDIYQSDAGWQTDFDIIKGMLPTLSDYEGKLGISADSLYGFLAMVDQVHILMERVHIYANQKYHEDTSNPVYQDLSDRASNLGVQLSGAISFAVPEILDIKEEVLDAFKKEDEKLSLYDFYLKDIIREKPHVLSAEMEGILAETQEMSGSPQNIFMMFNNADLKFPTVEDEKGNLVQLTHGRYSSLMESSDRKVREETFKKYHETYYGYRNMLASTFSANVKQELFYTKVRKYQSSMEKELSGAGIAVEVYTNLIEAVHENMPLMHRYVSLRKKLLGVDELHMYDLYAPLVQDVNMKVPYEQGKDMVMKGLHPMGDEYLSILQDGFNSRWIDVYENENKRSGAYSWGPYGFHPYVLLNYNNRLGDVFTLAHEMGHAIHSYYSDKNQPYIYAGYKIFVAEVASTCNESLLIDYLLKETTDKKEKAYLINHFLEKFKATLFRQTMFAEFEMITHDMAQRGESLTAASLCKVYHELNKAYFGEDIVIDEQIDMEWSRIPHFYNAFYVYQYATGYSAAIALSQKILKEGKPAVDDYIRFLSSGSSNYPIELLKAAGVDMSTKEPVQQALGLFERLLNQMEELML